MPSRAPRADTIETIPHLARHVLETVDGYESTVHRDRRITSATELEGKVKKAFLAAAAVNKAFFVPSNSGADVILRSRWTVLLYRSIVSNTCRARR